MIEELDVVALTQDIDGTYLRKGDLGTVVLVYGDNEAYMVEFVLQTGFTACLQDFDTSCVRPLKEGEIERKKRREWKPEWTDKNFGYVPPISKLSDWYPPPTDGYPNAHYLSYVDGAGQQE